MRACQEVADSPHRLQKRESSRRVLIEVSNKLRSAGFEIPWELLAYLMNTLETDQIDHWSDYAFPEEDFSIFLDLFRTKDEMLDFYNEFRRIVLYAAAYHASQVPVESELAKELGQE